jgi:16S rRNA (cytidine1402-2'-O)-methyltransferase
VAVARELTKVHEEVWRGAMAEAAALFAERQVRGEVVLVVAGAPAAGPVSDEAIDDAVRRQLDPGSGHGPRQIADIVAREFGVPRRKVYEAVLRLRRDGEHRTER